MFGANMLMTGPILRARTETRRSISVEKLLSWAYRTELTKAAILGWTYNNLTNLWDYGTHIDKTLPSGYGGRPYYASVFEDVGTPHEDALLIHETVSELDSLKEDWHGQDAVDVLMGDMSEGVRRAAWGLARDYKAARTATVVSYSKMGARPRWECDEPERKPVTGANGRPLWVIDRELVTTGSFGAVHTSAVEEPFYHSKKKQTPANARMKMAWEPSIRSVVSRRADYCHWHASLAWLAEELPTKLIAWVPTSPLTAPLPWLDGEASEPRILPSLARAA